MLQFSTQGAIISKYLRSKTIFVNVKIIILKDKILVSLHLLGMIAHYENIFMLENFIDLTSNEYFIYETTYFIAIIYKA